MIFEILITAVIVIVAVMILYKNIKSSLKGKCVGCKYGCDKCGKCIYGMKNNVK